MLTTGLSIELPKRDTHPQPRIDEWLERLDGARFFSKIDLKSGCHQVRIQKSDVEKTAFNTRNGSFEISGPTL
jgi:hypothetical protein